MTSTQIALITVAVCKVLPNIFCPSSFHAGMTMTAGTTAAARTPVSRYRSPSRWSLLAWAVSSSPKPPSAPPQGSTAAASCPRRRGSESAWTTTPDGCFSMMPTACAACTKDRWTVLAPCTLRSDSWAGGRSIWKSSSQPSGCRTCEGSCFGASRNIGVC